MARVVETYMPSASPLWPPNDTPMPIFKKGRLQREGNREMSRAGERRATARTPSEKECNVMTVTMRTTLRASIPVDEAAMQMKTSYGDLTY
jgi:hypothetical protein